MPAKQNGQPAVQPQNAHATAALQNLSTEVQLHEQLAAEERRLIVAALESASTRQCTSCMTTGHIAAHCWMFGQAYYECKLAGVASSIAWAKFKVSRRVRKRAAKMHAKHAHEVEAEKSYVLGQMASAT